MTKLSEDDCSSKDEKKDGESDNDGTITNDPNHPLLKVRHVNKRIGILINLYRGCVLTLQPSRFINTGMYYAKTNSCLAKQF